MKRALFFILACLCGFAIHAQSDPRIAHTKTPLSQVEQLVMPHLDNEALMATEVARRAPGVAPKFAETMEVDVSPSNHGHWEYLPNGNAIWRLRLRSAGAKSLNLGFTKYSMPAGGSLVLYSPDYQQVMGPFTPADNEEHEQLWTPILPTDELVMEVQLPAHSQSALQLELKYVNHDFAGFAAMASGSCNLDVICGAADGWAIVDAYRDIIQSVAVISTGGATFCTGFLVNNARQDCAPFFMTANHCGINAGAAASLVTYWNFFNSTCRQPGSASSGGNGNGLLNDFNTGSTLKASWATSDFTLVELDDPVSPTADAFFAGWSAEDFAPSDTAICIHHPSTDEKRISFEFDPLHTGTWGTGGDPVPNGNHLIIPDWDLGTTEGGSSGSPLFNRQKRVVGQLHGGNALCGNNDYDSFGWFHSSWEGGGSPTSRLKDWLDPDNTGVIVLDGRSQLQCSFFVEGTPANVQLCAPADAVYTIHVSDNFTADVTLSTPGLPAGLVAVFAQNPVAPGGTTTLTISNTAALATGNYTLALDGTDGSNSNSSDLTLYVATQVPTAITPGFPANGATGIGLTPQFTWQSASNTSYAIEIATDPGFSNIIGTAAGLASASFLPAAPLTALSTYYWRVKGANICGESDWSTVFEFETGAVVCGSGSSTNVPLVISASGTPTVPSTYAHTGGGYVDDVNVTNLNINHSWVGDLRVEITSPSGTTITVLSNPGGGDCDGNDVQLAFDDEAANDYNVLDQTCNPASPAIQGIFQPFEALNAFDGEPANGVWTLTVYDDVSQDGGTLLSWGLDICSTIPDDLSVTPSTGSVESCVDNEAYFTLSLGTAFDDAGVTLTAEGLPAGATASFSPNPAPPGAQVDVTVGGVGSASVITFDILAADGIGNIGNTEMVWTVFGAPDAPTGVFPAQNASAIGLNPPISWTATGTYYHLALATDPAMTELIFTADPTSTTQLVNGLLPCTTYYWTVTAETDCGLSTPLEVYAFTTLDDLAFNASPASVSTCNTSTSFTTLSLGECFEAGGVTLSSANAPAGMAVSFAANPVPAGGQVVVNLALAAVVPGTYTITINGTDGVNNVAETFNVVVGGPAASPVFVAPVNAAVDVDVLTAFDWNPVTGATNYKFELATDDNFSNIVAVTTIPQTNYTLVNSLDPLTTYYWRVTAFNNCGGTTPAPYSFTTWLANATHERNRLRAQLVPNPTTGLVQVNFSSPLFEKTDMALYAANGVLLHSEPIPLGQATATLDLTKFPAGVYWVKLKTASAVFTEKIILEH